MESARVRLLLFFFGLCFCLGLGLGFGLGFWFGVDCSPLWFFVSRIDPYFHVRNIELIEAICQAVFLNLKGDVLSQIFFFL